MRKYNVKITLVNGDEITSSVEASSRNEAIKIVTESDEYKRLDGNHGVADLEITHEKTRPWNNHLEVTNVPNMTGWYMAIDLKNNIKLVFKKGEFEKRDIYPLRGEEFSQDETIGLEESTRRISEWLEEYFPELVNRKQNIPRHEGAKTNANVSKRGNIPCFYSLKPHVAEFIKEQSAARGMAQGDFIEWMMSE